MCDHNGTLIPYNTEQEMLDVLKGDRLKPNLEPVWQATMLVDAASYGWNTAIEHMIESMEFSLDEYDLKNYTPLGYAALKGHYKTAVMLVDYGCDIDARNNMGRHWNGIDWFRGDTALGYALKSNLFIARFLLGQDASGEDDHGNPEPADMTMERVSAMIKEKTRRNWALVRCHAHYIERVAPYCFFWQEEAAKTDMHAEFGVHGATLIGGGAVHACGNAMSMFE